MKTIHKNHKLDLPPAKQLAIQRAMKPVLRLLGMQTHLATWAVLTTKTGQLCITLQPGISAFSLAEVESALFWKKYPKGMTAKELAAIPANSARRKNETALHLVLSMGFYPRGLTKLDLLEARGANKRRAIFALFDDHRVAPRYPADLTARDLAKIKSSDGGSLLHKAAIRGVFPRNTRVSDLTLVRDNFGMTPLHRAAQAGHLLPCSKADLQSVSNEDGRTAWSFAIDRLNASYDQESSVRNLLACPELAQKLDPKRKAHREKLELLLASPDLTTELRNKIAMYPRICAAML